MLGWCINRDMVIYATANNGVIPWIDLNLFRYINI